MNRPSLSSDSRIEIEFDDSSIGRAAKSVNELKPVWLGDSPLELNEHLRRVGIVALKSFSNSFVASELGLRLAEAGNGRDYQQQVLHRRFAQPMRL